MFLRNIKITKNPFIFFLPALLFYAIFIFILSDNALWGDENIYIGFANNLLHGFYSEQAPKISLSNGPGCSLFILPFVALHLPLVAIRLLNAILLYLSVILLYKVLIKFISYR